VHHAFEDVENFEPEMIVLNPRVDTIIAINIKSNTSVASQVLSSTQKLICDLFRTLTKSAVYQILIFPVELSALRPLVLFLPICTDYYCDVGRPYA
jgi:hypothetical protein